MATTQKKSAPKKGNGSGDHIAFEEIKNPSAVVTQPVVEEAHVITVEEQISVEKAKFNLADARIAELYTQYENLEITCNDDKDGYAKVKEAWNIVRSCRTGIEKKKKEIKATYIAINKAIDGEEARLVGRLEPLEEKLYKRWKAIDDAKEEAKRELERQAEQRLQDRIVLLMAEGMIFKDGFYQLGDTIMLDVATIRAQTEEQFEKLLGTVQAKAKEVQEAENQRLENERLENQRREEQQAELNRQQEALDNQRRQQEEAEQRLEDERLKFKKMKEDARKELMIAIGFTFSPYTSKFFYDDKFNPAIEIDAEEAFQFMGEDFDRLRKQWTEQIAEAKRKFQAEQTRLEDERRELEQRKTNVREKLTEIGMAITGDSFNFTNRVDTFGITMKAALELPVDAFTITVANFKSRISKAKADLTILEAQERGEKERQRKAELGDHGRLLEYFGALMAIELHPEEMTTDGYRTNLAAFQTRLGNLINEFTPAEEESKP